LTTMVRPDFGSLVRFRALPHATRATVESLGSVLASASRRRSASDTFKVKIMSEHVPHFQNDTGVSVIEIGATEFMCVGARPPFDHPHVFLDMGDDREIICPYCSTLYRHASDLGADEARPPECALKEKAA
jgi:uncharacterized Zn-finger protein